MLLALALMCNPAHAADIDCAALTSTELPYLLDVRTQTVRPGHEPMIQKGRRYLLRRGSETTSYFFYQKGDSYLRIRGIPPFFGSETYVSVGSKTSVISISIDTAKDYLASRQPFTFTQIMKGMNGAVTQTNEVSIAFGGETSLDLGPCHVALIKIIRSDKVTRNGSSDDSTTELWYSPELKAALHQESRNAAGTITYDALRIASPARARRMALRIARIEGRSP